MTFLIIGVVTTVIVLLCALCAESHDNKQLKATIKRMAARNRDDFAKLEAAQARIKVLEAKDQEVEAAKIAKL